MRLLDKKIHILTCKELTRILEVAINVDDMAYHHGDAKSPSKHN